MKTITILIVTVILLSVCGGCEGQGLTHEQALIFQHGFDQYWQMQRDIYNRRPIVFQKQRQPILQMQNPFLQSEMEKYYRRKNREAIFDLP